MSWSRCAMEKMCDGEDVWSRCVMEQTCVMGQMSDGEDVCDGADV